MSTNRSPKPTPPSGSSSRAASSRASRPSSTSDWLANSLITAKIAVSAAECAPFPFVKGAFGIVVVLLETVEKVKKNRENLKELCENTVEIMAIIKEQLTSHGDSAAIKFRGRCEEFESITQDVLVEVTKMKSKDKSFRSKFKEVIKLSSTADTIAGYQQRIRELRINLMFAATLDTNFQVGKALTPQIAPSPVAQRINDCPPASRIFEGRTGILNQMQDFFSTDSDNQRIFLLHGLGGAGKTQIALKFIEQSLSVFSDIFMIDATTTETIEADFQRIALAKNSGSTMPDALKWLVSTPEEWLLLFDSADVPKMNLNKFFPQCKHGNIVITSRNPGLRVYAGSDSLVSDMEETDAVNLLLKSASESDADENRQIATEIVKTLYYLPLAIIQAGAFISKSGALNSYLDLYVKNKARLLSEKPAQSHDDYRWTVYTTLQISFDQLSKPAATLLQFCSFLHHQGISEEIFSKASGYRFYSDGPTEEELQQPVEFLSQFLSPDGTWDPLRFIDITSEIRSYSLVNLNPRNKEFSIHPLVHEWTRSVLSDEEACHNCMCAILGMGISEIPLWDMTLASLRLLPHVDSILHKEDALKFDFDPEFAEVYYHSRRNEDALNLRAKVLEKRRNIFGNDHLNTLTAMIWLASTYHRLGQFTEAAELEVVALEKRRKILGDDHLDTLPVMGNVAMTYYKMGRFTEAHKLNLVVLEKRRKILGDDHPATLTAMGNLAMIYHKLGRFTEAHELNLVVLEKWRKILGDDHPHTLMAMGNLAMIYHKLGRFTEAHELNLVVLEKWRKILGDDHPHTLMAMGNLTSTYHRLGKFTEALELEVVVLEKQRKILGDDHPYTLTAMAWLASTYRELGKLKEAMELEVVVLEKQRKISGDDHPDTLMAMGNLASTYHKLGPLKEAAELQAMVLEKRRKILGDDHPDTVTTMGNLAMTYHKLWQFTEAVELQVVVLEKRRKILGDHHPDTLLAMSNLALAYHKLGQFIEAAELEVVVLDKLRKFLGDDHPDTLLAMGNLAFTFYQLGQLKEAQELQVVVLEKRTQILGPGHPHTLVARKQLGWTYTELGSPTGEIEALIQKDMGREDSEVH
ncbi:hypothetical protein C8R43DRAFT_563088 [Mycena crocata]|nr:hypothetical protein C8R43DRAFT_563088 [Mycena crocata]